MRHPDERAELIGLIYEAALDPKVWPLVTDRLADALHARVGQLATHQAETLEARMVVPRMSPESLRSYADYWVYRNTLITHALRHPVGTTITFEEIVPREELRRTEIYKGFFVPHEHGHMLGTRLLEEGPFSAMLAVYRPERMGVFDAADRELLAGLIPHLQRAVQLNRRFSDLEMAGMASAEMLDRLRQASLLVDAGCRVAFANRAAEEILTDRMGLHRGADGVLRAERHAETTALHKMVAVAAGRIVAGEEGPGGRLRLSRGEDRAPLSVLVIPLRAETNWLAPRQPTAMLFITDPERSSNATAARLRADFALTRMEAAIALEVLDGQGLKVAARRLGISPTTARTHLTAVFDKTGTRRQAELVRVLMQSDGAVRED
jgi:DNA-binding CsgD family transcriptional regulator